MGKNLKTKKGFTLIEVVLVLAIGGLIILMALLVFPNAMANLRDTQRREDFTALSTSISNFSASNSGKIIRLLGTKNAKLRDDACRESFLDASAYVNSTGEDPNGYPYEVTVCTYNGWKGSLAEKVPIASDDSENGKTEIIVVLGADCDDVSDQGYSIPNQNNSTKAYAIFGGLETGSKTYCNANMGSSSASEESE